MAPSASCLSVVAFLGLCRKDRATWVLPAYVLHCCRHKYGYLSSITLMTQSSARINEISRFCKMWKGSHFLGARCGCRRCALKVRATIPAGPPDYQCVSCRLKIRQLRPYLPLRPMAGTRFGERASRAITTTSQGEQIVTGEIYVTS
jgi:hypothetical protein